MKTPNETDVTDSPAAPPVVACSDLLGARNEIYKQVVKHRNERNWLNDHNHKIEAMVKHQIQEQLERAMWTIESLLDKANVKYTYNE